MSPLRTPANVQTLRQQVRSAATALLAGASLHIACAATPAALAPAAIAVTTQPPRTVNGAGCARTPPEGGAARPTIAPADLQAKLKDILTPYRGASLNPAAATEIRAALCQAGVWSHPGLDQALAAWGLSVKQIEAIAPAPSDSAARPEQAPSGTGRRIPPRE